MIKRKLVKKAKVKERNSDEYYKAQIRALEKENRSLKKQLKQLERMEQNFHKEPDDEEDEDEFTPVLCKECGKGSLNIFTIGPRTISTCSLCGTRKVTRNG